MTILFIFPAHPKDDITGAGNYHRLLIDLFERHGHTCIVNQHTNDFDIVISGAFSLRQYDKPQPSFVIVHNERKEHLPLDKHCVIYVAEHLRNRFNYKSKDAIVWHPMCKLVPVKKAHTKERGYIGVVNLNRDKGGFDVQKIAAAIPDQKFLLIRSWGTQIEFNAPNVEWMTYNSDVTPFYNRIDTLFCPSYSEGYNTTVLEAMSQGIAIVGRNIPGITEVAGDAGLYGEHNGHFIDHLRKVGYKNRVAALARFDDVQQDEEVFLKAIYQHGQSIRDKCRKDGR